LHIFNYLHNLHKRIYFTIRTVPQSPLYPSNSS